MTTNPYQSPQVESTSPEFQVPRRAEALQSVRIATLLLTADGVFNVFAFYHTFTDFYIIVGKGPIYDPREIAVVSFAVILVFLASWFLLLPVLEFLGQLLREMLAPRVNREQWNEALYLSLKYAAWLAVPGMILWLAWVIAFYYLRLNFYLISYAVGIPAHILAACVYVPLLYRWFKLWRRPQADREVT